ncbi:MAG: hypothetical protein R3F20_03120 [Planctomycetota bacterium]
MDRRSGFVVAHGFEFDFLNLMLPGSAGNTTQGGSSISSFGYGLPTFVNWTPPSPQNAAIGTHAFLNSLFGATGEVFFAPALGRWLGSTLGDEDGDGAIDRLDLVGNPPQLVYSSGLASQPTGPAKQHRYQLVLEATDPIAIYSGWTSGARVVSAADRDLVFTRITGTSPPLYAQSLRDLVPDADPDEAIVLRRVAGQSSFVLRVYDDVDGTPFILQSITLPGGYVPREIAYADADADGDLDLSCCEATTGEVLRFVNGGAGTFTMLQGPLHPGTQEDFRWEFRINGVPPAACDIVPVAAGDIVEILIDSPMGTFDGTPLVLLGQYFTPGFPPAGVPAFGAAVSPGGSPAPFVIFDGSQPGPFGGPSVPLPPGGSQHAFLVPPGFVGISIMTQVLALTPTAANGFFASSHGVELRAP